MCLPKLDGGMYEDCLGRTASNRTTCHNGIPTGLEKYGVYSGRNVDLTQNKQQGHAGRQDLRFHICANVNRIGLLPSIPFLSPPQSARFCRPNTAIRLLVWNQTRTYEIAKHTHKQRHTHTHTHVMPTQTCNILHTQRLAQTRGGCLKYLTHIGISKRKKEYNSLKVRPAAKSEQKLLIGMGRRKFP